MNGFHTREIPPSAHEIDRRVRQIERDRDLSGVTPWSRWKANGAVWGHGAMEGENVQTNAVPIATVSQAKRIAAFAGERRNMSSNRSALDALAQEGIPMTEEQLLGATQKMRSNRNGATLAQTKGQVMYSNGIGPTTTTGNTKPGSGRPHRGAGQSRAAAGALATGVRPNS